MTFCITQVTAIITAFAVVIVLTLSQRTYLGTVYSMEKLLDCAAAVMLPKMESVLVSYTAKFYFLF